MKQNILQIGLDVDDKQYHRSALSDTQMQVIYEGKGVAQDYRVALTQIIK